MEFTPEELDLMFMTLGVYRSDYEGTQSYRKHAEMVDSLAHRFNRYFAQRPDLEAAIDRRNR